MNTTSKLSLSLYYFYASIYAAFNYVRGENNFQPSYKSGESTRIRRSLFNLGDSFMHGWHADQSARHDGALVVYAATIGEFHPLMPVIDSYLKNHNETPLVIFSGQFQYVNAISALYPNALVGLLPPSAPWLYDKLFKLLRPCAVVLGEGPCAYLHFPIPFDLALSTACLRHNTPMLVVNATLHALSVPSTVSRLEDRYFGKLFGLPIRYWYTPNEAFKSWLVAANIPPEKIVLTGDLRFDDRRHLGTVSKELASILSDLKSKHAPIIVAGSVNAIDEEGPLIDGWLAVREKHEEARLIIAPRHVNNTANMELLYNYLAAKNIQFVKRSSGASAAREADVIIVDVFGELPHFYSVASIAYIGRNHGVLEPLRFLVPTVVAPQEDWAAAYVTFPTYKLMIDNSGIIEASDKKNLGQIFCRIIDEPDYGRQVVENALDIAKNERQAGETIALHMERYVNC